MSSVVLKSVIVASLCFASLAGSVELQAQSLRQLTSNARRFVSQPFGGQPRLGQQILNQQLFNRQPAGQAVYPQTVARQHSCQPAYRPPVYQPPVYQPPVYQPPVYSQPTYIQPVVTSAPAPPPQPKPSPAAIARKHTSEAIALFRQGRYEAASKKLDEVVKRAPKDTNAYQFRALAQFANGKFDSAARDAYDALALGNTWTGDVLKSIYGPDLTAYDRQMGTLKKHVQDNASMSGHFLLAYHHLLNAQWAQGEVQLQAVMKLQEGEPLSAKLLAAVQQKMAAEAKTVAANQ